MLAAAPTVHALNQRTKAEFRLDLNTPLDGKFSTLGFEFFVPGLHGAVLEFDPSFAYNWGVWDFGLYLGCKAGYEKAPLLLKAGLEALFTREDRLGSGEGIGGVFDSNKRTLRAGYFRTYGEFSGFSVFYEGYTGAYTYKDIPKRSPNPPRERESDAFGNGMGTEISIRGVGATVQSGIGHDSVNGYSPYLQLRFGYAFL